MARRRARYSRNRGGPSWLTTGILMGLSVVVVMNWELIRGYINTAMNTMEAPKVMDEPKEAPAKSAKKQQTQSPEFDFYNMLGDQKSAKADKSVQPAQKPAPVNEATAAETKDEKTTSEQYVLQIASLPSYQDADRLKAELTMMGFDVSIQAYQHNDKTWYRVNAGPYASKAAALAKQTELQQNSVIGVLVKQ